jgi:hypothetical protein
MTTVEKLQTQKRIRGFFAALRMTISAGDDNFRGWLLNGERPGVEAGSFLI